MIKGSVGKKIGTILFAVIMLLTSIPLFVNHDINLQANPQDDGQGLIGLDYDYMWEVTTYISNAVHNAYNGSEIRKGRAFGSKGCEDYSKKYINKEMHALCLDDVQNVTLGPIRDYLGFGTELAGSNSVPKPINLVWNKRIRVLS